MSNSIPFSNNLGKEMQTLNGVPKPLSNSESKQGVEATVEIITPETAARYMVLNTSNRSIREMHVNRICKDIANGKWRMTGDPIRFNGSHLVDGQHRLLAIARSGIAVQCVVVRGLDEDIFAHIDTNSIPRQASDALGMNGFKHAKAVASIVKMVHCYGKGRKFSSNYETKLSHDQVLEIALSDVEYQRAAAFAGSRKIPKVLSESLLGSCYFLTSKLSNEEADMFWKVVSKGAASDDQIKVALLLREKMFVNASSHKKISIEHKFAYCVRAWNAFRERREIAKFVYKPGTAVPRFV